MDDVLKCVGCGIAPPETESAYTLIGGKAGWRFTRVRAPDGSMTAEWRCPECWKVFKKASGATSGTPANPPPAAGTPAPPRGAPTAPTPKRDSISPAGPHSRRRG